MSEEPQARQVSGETDLAPAPGVVAAELREEFPGLRLDWVTIPGSRRSSPRSVARRLADLSSRYRGASVVAMRTQPVTHAYRAFFRHIGLDPDVDRVPSEQAAVARLLQGGFRSVDLVEDVRLIALLETGVPVWALDNDRVALGGPGIRFAGEDEWLGDEDPLEPGTLVVADAERVHARLFGDVASAHAVTPATTQMTLFSVGVDGVPAIHVEEALWLCLEALGAG